MGKDNLQFQTEVQQLLQLMIHSVYSNKDIFIRELVANAADALDKARFESISRPELAREWEIRIAADKDAGTLTFIDNGIGMDRDELINNIGTIAKSGTKAFIEALKAKDEAKANDLELIGQFGVGFYSAFMAASQAEIITKKAGAGQAWKWVSEGKDTYSIEEAEREFSGKGYGDFKAAVGEVTADALAPVQAEFYRLLADKAGLEAQMKKGAEEASWYARRTLSKVQKKLGFVQLH